MASLRKMLIAVLLATVVMANAGDTDGKQQHLGFKRTCAKLLRTSANSLEQYMRSEYPEEHDTACYIRCIAILHGAYDDETGVVLASLYKTYGKGLTEAEFVEQAETCLRPKEGEKEVTCHCMKAYKPMMCIREQFRVRTAEGN